MASLLTMAVVSASESRSDKNDLMASEVLRSAMVWKNSLMISFSRLGLSFFLEIRIRLI